MEREQRRGLFTRMKDGMYGVSVKLHEKFGRPKKERGINRSKRGKLIFYCCLIVLPMLQYCVFYLGVNFNSILLAFRQYDLQGGGFQWVGFQNFQSAFDKLFHLPELTFAFRNSLIAYACSLLVGIPLAVFFSYYIFKKFAGYRFFKVVLFMPSIVSAMIMSVIFSVFSNRVIPFIFETYFHTKVEGLLSNVDTLLPTMIAYTIYIGFGANILMYVGAMSNIPESVIESAQLDGASNLQELWYIVFPMIWPTLATFIVVGLTGVFTNQINLYPFFSDKANVRVYTYGYYLYVKTVTSTTIQYPELAALGLIFTAIAAPLTLAVRKLLDKFGPSTD